MSDASDVPPLERGRYARYKGDEYEVIGVGRHTEKEEYFVVYQTILKKEGTPKIWLRPYDMFIETVEVDGKKIPRFTKV